MSKLTPAEELKKLKEDLINSIHKEDDFGIHYYSKELRDKIYKVRKGKIQLKKERDGWDISYRKTLPYR
tara:strand:+ start:642 stop:848 length:207 start_codon:yes stop_codon:yes gene_type:complete